jgi:hypothetical protein
LLIDERSDNQIRQIVHTLFSLGYSAPSKSGNDDAVIREYHQILPAITRVTHDQWQREFVIPG